MAHHLTPSHQCQPPPTPGTWMEVKDGVAEAELLPAIIYHWQQLFVLFCVYAICCPCCLNNVYETEIAFFLFNS